MSKPKIDRNIKVPLDLIKELLTPCEWRMVKQRLLLVQLISQGLPIRVIAEQARVGTDTVVRMSKKLDESPRLKGIFKNTKSGSSSKWVFGQIGSEEE